MAIEVEASDTSLLPSDLVMVGLPAVAAEEGGGGPELLSGLSATIGNWSLPEAIDPEDSRQQGFAGKTGQVMALASEPGSPRMLVVGMGKRDRIDSERWRRAAAAVVRAGGEGGSIGLVVPTNPPGGDAYDIGAAIAEGAILAGYKFESYRTKSEGAGIDRLLVASEGSLDLVSGVERGRRRARAVTFARDLVNTPPSDLPPRRFAEIVVERLSGAAGTSVEVWEEDRIADERLGALAGVARGSHEPPRLIQATYEPANPVETDGHVPHVVLVGKGITFDSGGLSLKTAEGMTTMKTDMSGAAVVLAALSACGDLDVGVRVTAIAPCTENMPGGRAIKPGDVLSARNGSTIEVLNTDAEGRLVLADGLCLAVELEPDAIVDVATLTGAAVVALGRSIGALFGTDEKLLERIRQAADRSGEMLWQLPLPEEYADHIDSDVADMKNTGAAGEAGAISAALLLARFTGDVPWAHLDIAGPARATKSSGYLTKGGTGFAVRTLLELLASYRTEDDS